MLLLQRQVKYVEDTLFTRDTDNLGISRKEMIQAISDIVQASYYVQAENHLGYLIREKWVPNLKRHGQVIKAQETTTERSQICVSQKYC